VLLNLRAAAGASGAPLEARLADRARARRLPVFQIEGVEEQIFTFDELPMDAQVALLKHSLAHRDELLQLAERTLEAYLAGDLQAIWRLREQFSARHAEVAAYQAALTKRVVHDRSVVMAFRMQRELRRGNAFVALGACISTATRGPRAARAGRLSRAAGLLMSVVALISGRGSNLRALVEAGCPSRACQQRRRCQGLEFARSRGIATRVVEHRRFPPARLSTPRSSGRSRPRAAPPVALAGFMRVLGAVFVRRYAERLLNIHPALLPSFRA
jgi:hypothetical protein